jgi:hypothetical protein
MSTSLPLTDGKMAGIQIPILGGRLKLRRKVFMRSAELNRELPVVNVGLWIVSWWSKSKVEQDRREFELFSRSPPNRSSDSNQLTMKERVSGPACLSPAFHTVKGATNPFFV